MKDLERALVEADPEERRHAVARIPEAAGNERVHLLLAALGDADWRVRKEATSVAMALAPDRDVLVGLLSLFSAGDNVGQRNAAVEALAGFGAAAVSEISAVLKGLDADGRKLAVEALARCGDPAAIDVLESVLSDPDPNVRATAIEAIAMVGSASVERAGALLKSRLTAADRFEVLAALEGINRLGVAVEWEHLKALLDDPVLDRAALIAAGRSGHVDAAPRLVDKLDRARGGAFSVALQALSEFVVDEGIHAGVARAALGSLSGESRRRVIERARSAGDALDEQKAALLVVGALGTIEAADAVIAALSDDRVAGEAESALSMLGPAAILALSSRARSGTPQERAACIELLGRLADDSTKAIARQAIHDAAQDASPDVVRAALVALARLGDERSLGLAVRWLVPDAPPRVQHAAATALAVCSARHPDAARVLSRQARPDQASAAVAAIVIRSGSGHVFGSAAQDVDFLAVAVSNESAFVRRAAIEALAELESGSAIEAVAFALSDEAPEVRLAAARALGKIRDAEGKVVGLPQLLKVVRESADDVLVSAALEALGESGDPRALEELREAAKTGSVMRAVVAVEAMGRMRSADRLAPLLDVFGHPQPEVVKAAVRAVAEESDPRVDQYLARALEHDAWDVRRLCADILGQRGNSAAKRWLQDRLTLEEEPLVQEAIQRSLSELDGVTPARRTVPPEYGGPNE